MGEFVRARSEEQKEQRMNEIKNAADKLFAIKTYHEITLGAIADELSWSRANLYKYVTSKEEIFLEIFQDKQVSYFDDLRAAFPAGSRYSNEITATVWAEILNNHQDYLHYGNILTTIIETNVSIERLAAFKTHYYNDADKLSELFSGNLGITTKDVDRLIYASYYYSVGICTDCSRSPKIKEALAYAGIKDKAMDFRDNMKEFLIMCLSYYRPKK